MPTWKRLKRMPTGERAKRWQDGQARLAHETGQAHGVARRSVETADRMQVPSQHKVRGVLLRVVVAGEGA